MTKHPYLKEIAKTAVKVALIGGVTLAAATAAFGFAAGFFNMMTAGYIAGYATAFAGTCGMVKTAVKDIWNIPKKVKQQQREEHVDEQLENLKKEIQKIKEPDTKEIQKKKESQKTKKLFSKKNRISALFWEKRQNYRDAA